VEAGNCLIALVVQNEERQIVEDDGIVQELPVQGRDDSKQQQA
jgi:hypothetical protein